MSVPFEGVLAQDGLQPTLRKRATLTVSLLVHAAVLLAGIVYSFWHVEELPLPALAVTLHLAAPPPPPPPPAAKKRAPTKAKSKPAEVMPDTIVQPKSEPKEEIVPAADKREERADDGEQADEGGQEGGTLGGAKGGVVGGMVGGAAPPPPPKDTGPKILPPQIAKGQLAIDPNTDEYRVKLPPPLARAGMTFAAVLRICVSAQGTVTEVRIIRPADPAIDPQIPGVIGRWRYRPYTIDGRPIPFCYFVKYEISSR